MTFTQTGECLESCHVFANSLVFKQQLYCSFLRMVGTKGPLPPMIFLKEKAGNEYLEFATGPFTLPYGVKIAK